MNLLFSSDSLLKESGGQTKAIFYLYDELKKKKISHTIYTSKNNGLNQSTPFFEIGFEQSNRLQSPSASEVILTPLRAFLGQGIILLHLKKLANRFVRNQVQAALANLVQKILTCVVYIEDGYVMQLNF